MARWTDTHPERRRDANDVLFAELKMTIIQLQNHIGNVTQEFDESRDNLQIQLNTLRDALQPIILASDIRNLSDLTLYDCDLVVQALKLLQKGN